MARYSDLLDDVRPHVAEAPIPEVEDCIKRSVITFCRNSRIWREDNTLKLKVNQTQYRLIASGGRVEQITKAQFKDDQVGAIPLLQAQWNDVIMPERQGTRSQPRYFALSPDHAEVAIFPAIDSVQFNPKLLTYLHLVPERRGTSYPDWIREEWQEAIIHGALFYLYRTPRKPWSSQRMAASERFEFYTEINNATREARTDNWAPTMTKMRQWF